ncbi:unannotated protein [freshwater metagenome]|uniref:Unannotated protein n=1 Tax=freshwater metagenome TaxID=449393 RepID=A0A6J7CRQ8_9ZZZZ|nr:hypothetical protein [Actinomycetota bacterium]
MNALAMACAFATVWIAMSNPFADRLDLVTGASEPSINAFLSKGKAWFDMRRANRPERAARDIVELAHRWAGELGAGSAPLPSLLIALREGPEFLTQVADRLELGADPVKELSALADQPGCMGAGALAACWQVGTQVGGGLARTLLLVAEGLGNELLVREEVRAQVAAPRATAQLVAALPLAGPLLTALLGANFLTVFTHTAIGRLCLFSGLAFDVAGILWVRQIMIRASR